MDNKTLQNLVGDLSNAFVNFKKVNDERLGQLEAKGNTDPLLEEKVDRANAEINRIQKQIDQNSMVLNRPGGTGDISRNQPTKGFDAYLRTGDSSELDKKTFNLISGEDGGFAAPTQLDNNLRNWLYSANVMRRLSTVVESYTGDYKIAINKGGLVAGWVGEKDNRPETGTPKIAQLSVPIGELYCNPAATTQMLDDVNFDMENWLMGEVQSKFASMEGNSFLFGTSFDQPFGVLSHPSDSTDDDVRDFGTLKYRQTSGISFTPNELIELTYDLKNEYRTRAAFIMNSRTASYIRKLDNINGDSIWQPAFAAGQPNMILGFRVEIDESMPDIAAENVPILFGDFKAGYKIVDRTPLRVLRDHFTNKPYIHFYCTKRVGGMVVESKAIRLLKMAAES